MKDRIISWILWIVLWWIIVYSYWYYNNQKSSVWTWNIWWTWFTQNLSNMSDTQLERMATRGWITVDELKAKIKSGEDLWNILPRWNFWTWTWSRDRTWTWSRNRIWTWISL